MPLIKIDKSARDNIFYQYPQYIIKDDGQKIIFNWCWWFSFIIAFSSLSNIKVPENILVGWINGMTKRGITNKGNSIQKGAETSTPQWNKQNPDSPMKTWMGSYGSNAMWRHLYQGKPVIINIRTGERYWKDREDGELSEISYRLRDFVSEHAITVMKGTDRDYLWVDSRGDGKMYKVTRKYMESMGPLLASNIILFVDKA